MDVPNSICANHNQRIEHFGRIDLLALNPRPLDALRRSSITVDELGSLIFRKRPASSAAPSTSAFPSGRRCITGIRTARTRPWVTPLPSAKKRTRWRSPAAKKSVFKYEYFEGITGNHGSGAQPLPSSKNPRPMAHSAYRQDDPEGKVTDESYKW